MSNVLISNFIGLKRLDRLRETVKVTVDTAQVLGKTCISAIVYYHILVVL